MNQQHRRPENSDFAGPVNGAYAEGLNLRTKRPRRNRSGAHRGDWYASGLEYGFRGQSVVQWQTVQDSDDRGQLQ